MSMGSSPTPTPAQDPTPSGQDLPPPARWDLSSGLATLGPVTGHQGHIGGYSALGKPLVLGHGTTAPHPPQPPCHPLLREQISC